MGVLMYETNMYEGMLAETVSMRGANGDHVNAYFARPLGSGSYPGLVLIHHLLGWDEWYRWAAREFAYHGFMALVPNLYAREGQGPPEEIAADVQAAGGIADDQALGDIEGALQYLRALPYCNGKVGCFGTGSGGRHAVLAASRIDRFNAAIDCWGGGVVMSTGGADPQATGGPHRLHHRPEVPAPRHLWGGWSGTEPGPGGPA